MATKISFEKIWGDAGLLREYAYEEGLGAVLIFGGSSKKWQRIRSIIRRIVQLTKVKFAEVQQGIEKDYCTGSKWN